MEYDQAGEDHWRNDGVVPFYGPDKTKPVGLVVDGSNFRKILWSSTFASALREHRSIEYCTRDIGTERTRTDEAANPRPVFSSRDSHR